MVAVLTSALFVEAGDGEEFLDLDVQSWQWGVLALAILVLLSIDLYRHREAHAPTFSEASKESAFWVFCGVTFSLFFVWQFGGQAAGEYLGVYLTEKSLSIDNVFVWALLFSSMKIPLRYQHRVLFWGIFGALLLRSIFIFAGAAIVTRFSWVLIVFGVFLIYTGIKIMRHTEDEGDDASTAGLGLLRRIMPVSESFDGQKFFTVENGVRAATPLFAALVVVETTDVVFAVDSVPASFGVANDPFTILAANAFAIMGLRAMYFLLADARERFHYLSHALGGILLFVGIKLSITPWYHIDIYVSLAIIVIIMIAAIFFSIYKNKQIEKAQQA
ncbi:MAG: tellurite resistance protein TerC [Acidimicrobiales bacterium]|jgi:tellurite resistance protein TerC